MDLTQGEVQDMHFLLFCEGEDFGVGGWAGVGDFLFVEAEVWLGVESFEKCGIA